MLVKSTLIKVIGGTERPDAGTLILQGKQVEWRTPHEARDNGIAVVHQELSLIGDLTVMENIFLRRERLSKVGLIRRRAMVTETQELFERLAISGIGPHVTVRQLSPSQKQLVEIAKAVKDSPAVLILDEPTSSLGEAWVEWLFGRLADWRAEGMAIAFISHRIAEITAIGDAITVLRNGHLVLDVRRGERSERELIAAMSGRDIDVAFAKISPPGDEPVLTVSGLNGLSGQRWPRDVSFTMNAGEIVGIGGLDGQGQRELLLSLYGINRAHGTVRVADEKPLHRWSPSRMQDLACRPGASRSARGRPSSEKLHRVQHGTAVVAEFQPMVISRHVETPANRPRGRHHAGAVDGRLLAACKRPEWWQPAEGGARQVAARLAKTIDPVRRDPRSRHRHEGADIPPSGEARLGRPRRPVLHD